MARRRAGSTFGDLVDLVAMLPWWLGVGLAVVAYATFNSFAALPSTPAPDVRPGEHATAVLLGAAASIARYLVPFICLLGAGMSAWRRAKRKSLVQGATKSDAAGAVARMSWREFEMLVGEAFRLDGYRVLETGTPVSPNSVWGKRSWRTTIDVGALHAPEIGERRLDFVNGRVDNLLIEALELPTDERSALVVALLDSLEGSDDAAISDAWREEIRQRKQALKNGTLAAVPWAEARGRLSSL